MGSPGLRHGVMPSSELEHLILRNSEFLYVCRAGDGDGRAGLYSSITGEYIHPVQGGLLPEYSRHNNPEYNCSCTQGGYCRTSLHGTSLVLGWRNILFKLLTMKKLRPTKEIKRVLGADEVMKAYDYGLVAGPQTDPTPSPVYSGVRT